MVYNASTDSATKTSSDGKTEQFLLAEYEYLTESSFHTDKLRDQFIQYYLILVGVVLSIMVALPEIDAIVVDPLIYGLASFLLFVVGAVLVAVMIRLRRVVWETYNGTALIKNYFLKHAAQPDDLYNALLWDASTVPKEEKWYTATSLLAILVMLLNSSMLGASVLLLAASWLMKNGGIQPLWFGIVFAIALLGSFVQWQIYSHRISIERRTAAETGRLNEKLKYFQPTNTK